tara:strand:+ start:42903 stop:43301 length:399 start_codon:yes stop_codon:yes gene_type:complete
MKINENDISAEEIDGELIAINFDTGKYFALEGTAIEIWNALAAGHEVEAIVQSQSGRSGFSAEAGASAIRTFVEQLREEKLFLDGGKVATEALVAGDDAWHAPLLTEFDDMAAMLKLDPVMDVGEVGWPEQE